MFQERLLVNGISHFGKYQIGYECPEVKSLTVFSNRLPGSSTISSYEILKVEDKSDIRSRARLVAQQILYVASLVAGEMFT